MTVRSFGRYGFSVAIGLAGRQRFQHAPLVVKPLYLLYLPIVIR